MQGPDYTIFTTKVWSEIAERLRAEQQALQLREFYRNLTEVDKRFLKALGIKWSTS